MSRGTSRQQLWAAAVERAQMQEENAALRAKLRDREKRIRAAHKLVREGMIQWDYGTEQALEAALDLRRPLKKAKATPDWETQWNRNPGASLKL